MPLYQMNGVRLLVEESGSGNPVVLVHGSWDDRRVWAPVEEELAAGFHVVSYDRRGHTASEAGKEEHGCRRDDEDDLAELIRTLGLAPANVVGNSFGASIALSLAGRRPDLFRALCAHEPPLLALAADDPEAARARLAMAPVLEFIERGDSELAAREFVEIAMGPDTWESISAEERTMMTTNARTFAGEQLDPAWADIDLDAVARIDFPVLLTEGDQSPPFFSTVVASLAGVIKGAEVRMLPGAGHEPHATHPDRYASIVSGFLAGSASHR